MKLFFLAAFIVFLSACNQQSKPDSENDSLATETLYEEPLVPDFNNHFRELAKFLEREDSSFSMEKFQSGQVVSKDTSAMLPMDRNTLLPFASFLKYNTDSSIALDLVSYNLMETTKNGRRHFDFAGPDTEIGLVDMKSMKRKRILFLGSAGIILDGKWENDQTILLAGAEDAGNGQIRPIMWRYHLDTYEVEVFSYPRTIKARAGMFYENKYNKVPVKTSPAV